MLEYKIPHRFTSLRDTTKTNYENNEYIYLNVNQYSSSFHRKSSFVG